jgi:hypothetical protein
MVACTPGRRHSCARMPSVGTLAGVSVCARMRVSEKSPPQTLAKDAQAHLGQGQQPWHVGGKRFGLAIAAEHKPALKQHQRLCVSRGVWTVAHLSFPLSIRTSTYCYSSRAQISIGAIEKHTHTHTH